MNCANHPDRERVAFCQHCGKPLCQECTRTVGSAVFCEPCLVEKLAGATPPAGSSYGYGNTPGSAGYADGTVPPPPIPGEPNPGLAALLGLIPGVGAMYNGQYAKGVVHLVVFAILVSLSSENGIFGLFIAGWVCYQVIEAYHTARARRDGTALPNPFGLNDLGERLGFGKAWPVGAPGQPTAPPTDPSAPPSSAYPPPAGYPPADYPPYAPPSAANWSTPWNWENHAPPTPPPYGAPVYPVDPNLTYSRNRFPTGAIWLIGLGAIFLIGNTGLFHGFPAHWLVPFLLIGFGVWQFVRKMTEYGAPLGNDGTPSYNYRLFNALKSSIWLMLVGIMFLLDSFHILPWDRSWPLFIIVAGLMAIFRGTAFRAFPAAPYAQAPPSPAPATPSATTTSIVPSNTHDQEGS